MIAVFTLVTWSALGADPAAPRLSLPEALAYARAHSPRLAADAAQVEASRSATRIPRSRWLPQLGATAQLFVATDNDNTAVTLGLADVPLPRIGASGLAASPNWSPYASTLAGIGGTQQIFDFGLTAAQTAAADAALAAAQQDFAAGDLDTTLRVTVAYRAVQAAHAVASAAAAAVLRAKAHRDEAAALVSGELRSRIFLERAEAQLSRLNVGDLQARAGVTVARSELAKALGSDGPEIDAVEEAPTAMPTLTLPTQAAAVDAAVGNDPQVKSLRARLDQQRGSADAIGDLTRPAVFVTAAISGRAGGAPASNGATEQYGGFLPQTPNWDIGVVAYWNLLDPVTLARAKTAHAQEQVIARQIDAAIQDVRSGAISAWVAAQAAYESLPDFVRAFDAAKANYEQADVRFKQGLGTSVEIADAENLLTDAEIDVARGKFAFGRAEAQLERAMAEETAGQVAGPTAGGKE